MAKDDDGFFHPPSSILHPRISAGRRIRPLRLPAADLGLLAVADAAAVRGGGGGVQVGEVRANERGAAGSAGDFRVDAGGIRGGGGGAGGRGGVGCATGEDPTGGGGGFGV